MYDDFKREKREVPCPPLSEDYGGLPPTICLFPLSHMWQEAREAKKGDCEEREGRARVERSEAGGRGAADAP